MALPRSVVFSGYLPESDFYKIEAILRFVRFTVLIIAMIESGWSLLKCAEFVQAVEGAARVLGECGSVVLGP
jgi:hypothetical protein